MGRGGVREGAGRKKKLNKKIPYSTVLRPDQAGWLKKQKSAAKEIENALDNHINQKDISNGDKN